MGDSLLPIWSLSNAQLKRIFNCFKSKEKSEKAYHQIDFQQLNQFYMPLIRMLIFEL